MKTCVLILLFQLSFNCNAQEDTLKPVLSSVLSDDLKVCVSLDSVESERVTRHFLWRHTDIFYTNGIKRYKTVQRRRFLRNMFVKNEFDRRTNMKFKTWDKNGRLISRSTLKPYGTDGKRKSHKYTYYENGNIKSKSINVKKGGCFLLVTKRADVKEYDENGKRQKEPFKS